MGIKLADYSQQPIIVLGMHRSGTTLLTRLLENSGIFFGKKRDFNQESRFFQYINEWLLKNFSTRWDHLFNPQTIDEALEDELADLVQVYLKSPNRFFYTGLSPFSIFSGGPNWGWKDPRTLYTLNVWKRVYPKARFIGIVRHGIDVAKSLSVRAGQVREKRYEKLQKVFTRRPIPQLHRKVEMIDSPLINDMDYGIKLWDNYNRILFDQLSNTHIFRYETLLNDPFTTMDSIGKALNLNISPNKQFYQKLINPDMAYKFKNWANSEFIERWEPTLNKYNY